MIVQKYILNTMTYLLEGKIISEEKPEKYFNRFVDFQKIMHFQPGLVSQVQVANLQTPTPF